MPKSVFLNKYLISIAVIKNSVGLL